MTLAAISPQTSAEGVSVSLATSATDSNTNVNLSYTLSGEPNGLSIDHNGVISGSTDYSAAEVNGGVYTVIVSVTDSKGAAASQSFNWFVTDTYRQPTLTNLGAKTNAEGDAASLQIAVANPEGNPLAFSASGLPAGLTIDPTSGLISGSVDYSAAETNGGHYTVLVSASDSEGGSAATTFVWTVTDSPRAPIVTNPGSFSDSEGDTASLSVSATSPDLRPLTYSAAGLPSGVSIGNQSGLISGTLAYTDAETASGTYNVTVTATDDRGLAASQTFVWTVIDTPRAPIVTAPSSRTNQEGDIVNLPIKATSPDGNSLSYSADGLPSGLSIDATSGVIGGMIDFTAAETQNGTYNVTVTVSAVDAAGNVLVSASQSFSWQVTAATGPLFITNPGAQSSAEGAIISFQTQAADPDGNEITRSVTGLPAGLTMDANGLITGTVSYSAAEQSSGTGSANGTYQITLSAVDSAGETASQNFTWTISDTYRPPVVAHIANQSSHEGDYVLLASGATAPEGNPFTFSATGLPSGLTINPNSGAISGALDFSDAEASTGTNPAGTYQVTVMATDTTGAAGSQSFTWTVADTDRAPTLANPGAQVNQEGDVVSLPLNASDLDGNTLAYSASGLPGGLAINAATGVIAGTLDFNDAEQSSGSGSLGAGQYSVTVTVSDGHGGSVNQTFAWSVSNAPRPGQVSAEGAVISYLALPTDPAGKSLTYTASGLPGGLSINTSTGLISGALAYTDAETSGVSPAVAGQYQVTVTATDSQGNVSSESYAWMVTHADEPPAVTNPGAQTDAEGNAIDLPIVATDAEGNALTFSASGLPGGVTIDPNTGVITGTLAFGDADVTSGSNPPGSYQVTVTATDNQSVSASQTFAWHVAHTEQLPIINNPGAQTSTEGGTISLAVVANSPDDDTLHFLATGLPGGISIDQNSGVISGVLDYNDAEVSGGAYTVTVAVFDAHGGVGTSQFNWTVADTTRPTRIDAEGAKIDFLVLPEVSDGKQLMFTATGLPGGVSIDPISGDITGTLDYSDAEAGGGAGPPVPGAYVVTVTATDAQGNAANESFHWTVTDTPRAPVVVNPAIESGKEGDFVMLPITASSPDGRPLWFSAANLPVGLSIDPASGLITGTISYQAAEDNSGPYNVAVTASDDRGLSTSESFL